MCMYVPYCVCLSLVLSGSVYFLIVILGVCVCATLCVFMSVRERVGCSLCDFVCVCVRVCLFV